MTIRELYTKHKKPILIGIVCLIVLALLAWFIFRHIEEIKQEHSAERALILKQRKEKEAEMEARHQEELRLSDSAMMAILGLKTRVEYKIIEREKYIKIYLDTASLHTKRLYLDSLFGPK